MNMIGSGSPIVGAEALYVWPIQFIYNVNTNNKMNDGCVPFSYFSIILYMLAHCQTARTVTELRLQLHSVDLEILNHFPY